jgi:prepilin-type N-terminal cleavage/methylation domain-containing protein
MRMLKNNKGLTLVEIMISIGILGIFVSAGYTGLSNWSKDIANFKRRLLTEDIISNIKNTASNRAGTLQVDYSDNSAIAILSDDDKLPFAWSTTGDIVMVKNCTVNPADLDVNNTIDSAENDSSTSETEKPALGVCPSGRYGYIVKPVTGAKGLYYLTIKITHARWDEPKYFNVLIGD